MEQSVLQSTVADTEHLSVAVQSNHDIDPEHCRQKDDLISSLFPDVHVFEKFQGLLQEVEGRSVLNNPDDDGCYAVLCYTDEEVHVNPVFRHAFFSGWHGVLHTMFSSHYRVFNTMKFMLQVVCCMYIFAVLLYAPTDSNIHHSVSSHCTAAAAGSISSCLVRIFLYHGLFLILFIYLSVDVMIQVLIFSKKYFLKRKTYHQTSSVFKGSSSSYHFHFGNIIRCLGSETFVYPILLTSIYLTVSHWNLISFRSIHFLELFRNPLVVSSVLLLVIIFLNRIVFIIHSVYSIQKAMCMDIDMAFKMKARSLFIQSIFFTYSFLQSTLQMLLIAVICYRIFERSSTGHALDWQNWLLILFSYINYGVGTFIFVITNLPLLQGFCIEFFHNSCKRIASSPHFSHIDSSTVSRIENEMIPLDPTALPGLHSNQLCSHPVKNLNIQVFSFVFHLFLIAVVVFLFLGETLVGYFMAIAVVLVHLLGLIVPCLVACCSINNFL